MPTTQAPAPSDAQVENKIVRLHITPLRPELLKVYLAPSILPLAQNISYHTVETFPDKGFGYIELPEVEANKIKKKLNGTTLRGSKVKIEMAKFEKRKAREEADAAKDKQEADRPSKRVKKEKKKKNELGVLDGVELPDDRKVKRGWTEPTTTKSRKEKKEKKDKKDKDKAREQKASKYTKEPEMLFKAKLTPVAATEVARKEKSKEKKKEKKDKNKSKSREVVVHEFEKNTKTPSFLKETKVAAVKKPAVDYVDGQGWVDEDGNIVEPETGKARQRRALELVDKPTDAQRAWIDGSSLPTPSSDTASKKKKENKKAKQAPLPPSSPPESEDDDSSVVSSSSEDVSSEPESESEAESSDAESAASARLNKNTQSPIPTSEAKEVHPLEALFKKTPKPDQAPTSAPSIKLTPINTSFSFFDNEEEPVEAEVDTTENMPTTPFTQRDLEWRGLRSAAPTPDTAAIGKRFSFDWRKSSQEADDDEDDEMIDEEAKQQLSQNTKANASAKHLPGVTEEDEEDADAGADQEQPESEFRKWFWENRGDLNRSWKKRRRDALKAKRHSENKKMTGGRRL